MWLAAPDGDGAPADPLVTIRAILPSLSPAERRVADWVLGHPADVVALSISAMADGAGTSEATVVRFCQKAGFTGYPDLRLALASRLGRSVARGRTDHLMGFDIDPDDSLADIVAKVGSLDAQAIRDTVDQLDLDQLGRVVDVLVSAHRIELVGVGASGLVAADLEQKLRRIGMMVSRSLDAHAALTAAAVLGTDAVCVGISHSGETIDVIEPIELAKARGVPTVAITNHPRSTLATIVDHVLTTAARDSVFRAGAMASRSAQLTVIDSIYLAVAQRNYDQALEALDLTSEAVKGRRTRARRIR